jgi:hypothetical protein
VLTDTQYDILVRDYSIVFRYMIAQREHDSRHQIDDKFIHNVQPILMAPQGGGGVNLIYRPRVARPSSVRVAFCKKCPTPRKITE